MTLQYRRGFSLTTSRSGAVPAAEATKRTFSRIRSAVAVQTKIEPLALCALTYAAEGRARRRHVWH